MKISTLLIFSTQKYVQLSLEILQVRITGTHDYQEICLPAVENQWNEDLPATIR